MRDRVVEGGMEHEYWWHTPPVFNRELRRLFPMHEYVSRMCLRLGSSDFPPPADYHTLQRISVIAGGDFFIEQDDIANNWLRKIYVSRGEFIFRLREVTSELGPMRLGPAVMQSSRVVDSKGVRPAYGPWRVRYAMDIGGTL